MLGIDDGAKRSSRPSARALRAAALDAMQSAALIVFLCDLGQPWAADGEARRLYSAGAMARRHVSSLPMDDSARVLLGVSAVAGAAGVSGRAVRFAIDDGRLKGVRRGRVWLIHPDDARAWIASRGSRAS